MLRSLSSSYEFVESEEGNRTGARGIDESSAVIVGSSEVDPDLEGVFGGLVPPICDKLDIDLA